MRAPYVSFSKEVGAGGGRGPSGCVGVSGGVRRTGGSSFPRGDCFYSGVAAGGEEGRRFESQLQER